uniref:DUF4773 domain-containing protein n=1 Tax=Mesocestoides corti TaxID=53468 RepID=A0A5K3FZX4_MESCO
MRFSLVLQLALLALLLVSATTNAFDSRLSIGTALDTSELTMRTEFPASVGEQLHIFQFPLQIHGRRIEQMKVCSTTCRLGNLMHLRCIPTDSLALETTALNCLQIIPVKPPILSIDSAHLMGISLACLPR